eukprot:SAG22_NODE_631_length_8376_cov_43.396037_3_plen_52_part_00
MATNPNQNSAGEQDGLAMADVVIVVDDAPMPDQDDQGAQDGGGKIKAVELI